MRRTILPALMIVMLLAGCAGGRDAEAVRRFQETLNAAEEIGFSVKITALGTEEAIAFTADVRDRQGETAVTVTAPDTIAGITYRSASGETRLEYDGLILALGPWEAETIPPAEGPALFLSSLREGELLRFGRDGENRFAVWKLEGTEVTVWLSPEDAPFRAELRRGEAVGLLLDVESWTAA